MVPTLLSILTWLSNGGGAFNVGGAQAAVADSLMDTAGISAFMSARRNNAGAEHTQTSSDKLLQIFVRDSRTNAHVLTRTDSSSRESEGMVAQDSEIACEYSEYSGDDFEEYEDEEVQEDADVMVRTAPVLSIHAAG